jgi:hypothetical protein
MELGMAGLSPTSKAIALLTCVPDLLACGQACPAYTISGDTGIAFGERVVIAITACLDDACSRGTLEWDPGAGNDQPYIDLAGDTVANFQLQHPDGATTWQYHAVVHLPGESDEHHLLKLEIQNTVANDLLVSFEADVASCLRVDLHLPPQTGAGGQGGGP